MKGHAANLLAIALTGIAIMAGAAAQGEPSITLGQMEARPGGVAVVPVAIDGLPSGVRAAGLNARILYPAHVLSMPSVAYGPLLDQNADLLESYSPRPGDISVIAACPEQRRSFNASSGAVFYLVFRVSPQALPGQTLPLTFAEASGGWPDTPPTGLSDDTGSASIAHLRVEGSVTFTATAPDPTGYPTVDSDSDGKPDGCETVSFALLRAEGSLWTNLYLSDSDGDGLLDGQEDTGDCPFTASAFMTNPRNPDSDGDGFDDGMEALILLTDPLDPNDPAPDDPDFADADGDGLPAIVDPDDNNPDTDGDGFADGYEALFGTDPEDPDSYPSLGDVNVDGVTNNVDAIMLLRYSLGSISTLPEPNNGDVNRDGVFNNMDAIVIFNWGLGVVPLLPFQVPGL